MRFTVREEVDASGNPAAPRICSGNRRAHGVDASVLPPTERANWASGGRPSQSGAMVIQAFALRSVLVPSAPETGPCRLMLEGSVAVRNAASNKLKLRRCATATRATDGATLRPAS